jgi:DNA-binding transcriptional ArsR family regulator
MRFAKTPTFWCDPLRRLSRPTSYGSRMASLPKREKNLHDITPYGVLSDMDHLSDVLTAISHPTRRAIIGRLAKGPARFLDVAKPFDTALNAVTKHLKLLERAGLIERRKQGREVFISFRAEPFREVAGWVNEYERFWNERLDQFQRYFEDKKQKRVKEK